MIIREQVDSFQRTCWIG